MDDYKVRTVKAESRELVRLSPELWKLGHGSLYPSTWDLEFDDMEDLRQEGAEGGVEECRLKQVLVHKLDPNMVLVNVTTAFESKDGRDLEFRREPDWGQPGLSDFTGIELRDDEVLTGIYETSTSCWVCWCCWLEKDLQLAFRVLNTSTGETSIKGNDFQWTHDEGFILEAPPGFYIAGFHGAAHNRLTTLGVYLRRLSPEWTSHGPEDPLFGPHLYPPSFVADHDWYLQARRVQQCPLSRLSNEVDSIILSKLLDLHLSSWDPHVQRARLVRPHLSDRGEAPDMEMWREWEWGHCLDWDLDWDEEGEELFWGVATRTLSRKFAQCNTRAKRRYRGRRGRTRMF